MNRFAVILAWDYKIPSAEKEIMDRLIVASENLGLECILADAKGFILDNSFVATETKIGEIEGIAFALHTHFSTAKWDDVYSFFTLWNPVAFLFAWERVPYYSFSYLTYDDYLSSDSANPNKHINYLLGKTGRNFDNSMLLFPTSAKNNVIAPNFAKSREKVFYCGAAWEKSAGMPVRHENLFKKLEQAGILEIYGPKKANNVEPWAGFNSYMGEIPFDGKSIFKKINEAGIVLALSSLEHQKAGIMSNRIFEAAAGGAVIITDKNDFVQKYFKDSVLTVENSGDWNKTADQIIEAYNWIINNKSRAVEMAEAAQEIYKNNFLMEQHLGVIFERLDDRKAILAKQIFAQNTAEQIDVVLRWDKCNLKYDFKDFKETIKQINRQIYRNIRLVVVLDESLITEAQKIIAGALSKDIEHILVPMKIFNSAEIKYSPLYRVATTGQMLQEAKKHIKNDYVAFIKSNDTWFSDHLTTLKRILENSPDCMLSHTSVATCVVFDNKTEYCDDYYYQYSIDKITEFDNRESDLLIMARRSLLEQINPDMLIYLDYLDFHFIMLQALKKENGVKFTYRKTALKTYYKDSEEENPQDFPIVQFKYQKEYIASLMQFDIPIEKLIAKPAGQQIVTQQIISSPMTLNRFSVLFFKLIHRGLVLYTPARWIPYYRKRMP